MEVNYRLDANRCFMGKNIVRCKKRDYFVSIKTFFLALTGQAQLALLV